jgi:hypothetical protein
MRQTAGTFEHASVEIEHIRWEGFATSRLAEV